MKVCYFKMREVEAIGTLICQECLEIIEHFDDEKVTTLYGTCPDCNQ